MSVEADNPKRPANEQDKKRKFHSSDLATPLFVFAGFGATYLSGITIVAAVFTPSGHSAAHFTLAYWPALLYLPCFLVALLRSRWASIPLWACCVALFVVSLMPSHMPAIGVGPFQPSIGMVLVPALAELARFFRGRTAANPS
jgi:hypothetical protein